MNIAVMKETHPGETRVPMVPATVERLVKLGAEVVVESGAGLSCRFDDAAYLAVGATISMSREEMLRGADIVLRLRKPPLAEIPLMRRGAIHISYLDPFNERELVDATGGGRDQRRQPGDDSAHHPGAEDGRAQFPGQSGGLCLGFARDRTSRQDPADDDHPSWNCQAGQGVCHRRRRCRSAGYRHGSAARCQG